MIRFKPSRTTVAAVVAVVLIIAAGGAAVASNMGFKMNKGLYPPNAAKPGAGDNWASLPYNRPYNSYADLCTQLALPPGSQLTQVNPQTGTAQGPCTCGTGCATTNKLDLSNIVPASLLPGGVPAPYLGVKIRSTAFVAGTSSGIVVGSHNPSLQALLVPIFNAATCPTQGTSAGVGITWLSVPYHTTAVTANDLCVQLNLPTGGAVITRVDPVIGNLPPVLCNTAAAANLNLVLGEAIKVRRSGGVPCAPIASIAAHF